mmetsp:Transcript_14658/g.24974  ORF Transcript_14658/g.24974 Transcript_14658/m.24974 type:complete len:151 (+) Transcript_14658:787-1239(+)
MRCRLPKREEGALHESKEAVSGEESKAIELWPTKKDEKACDGPVKPKIVFFGEKLPLKFHEGLDLIQGKRLEYLKELKVGENEGGCDLMLVIGTALAVFPFCSSPTFVPDGCPTVLINLNNTEASHYDFTDAYEHPNRLFLPGKCDDTII